MRGVSRWVSHVALLLAVSLIFGAAAWAGEAPPPPTNPLEWRLNPPGGVAAQARMQPPAGVATQARMNPPVGAPAQARMQPPGGAPVPMSLTDMILLWLQSRISVPNG